MTTDLRGIAVANALPGCAHCSGSGERPGGAVCGCVFRAVFRHILDQYRASEAQPESGRSQFVLQITGKGGITAALPHAEYAADFEMLVRRSLPVRQQRLFRLHFLEGRAWHDCLGPLGLDKGEFFREVYRVMEAVGRRAVQDGLYPARRYFGLRRLTSRPVAHERGAPEVPSYRRACLVAA